MMLIKLAIILLFVPTLIMAQNEEIDFSDEVPGSLVMDIGFSFVNDVLAPEAEIEFWGSKNFHLYYQYEIPLGNSGFSFNPGFGVADEKYAFDKTYTLVNDSVQGLVVMGLSEFIGLSNIDVKKSKIATTYFDIPIEFRFHSNKEDFQKSFKVAVGAKAGYLMGSRTKIKYETVPDGDKVILKRKEDYNLSEFRFGVYGRMGIGSFSFYYFQSITELFEGNRAPDEFKGSIPWQIGISYEIF